MTRPTRLLRLVAGFPLAIALSGVAVAPLPAAAQAACEAKVMSSGTTWGDAPQSAVDDAQAGDTIQIRGTCLGPVVIGKNLTLVGKPSTLLGAPGIYGQESVRVLEVKAGATVTVKNLEIAYGLTQSTGVGGLGFPGHGGGILNLGKLTLTNVVVQENDATYGGGIANHGTLLVNGASRIHHNRSQQDGAGIMSRGKTTLADTTAVYANTADGFGGGIVAGPGDAVASVLTLRDASVVRGNNAADGGGIASDRAPIVMEATSSVRGNTSSGQTGGIYLFGAKLTMTGRSSVKGNVGGVTGGIMGESAETKTAKVTLKGSSVLKGNTGEVGAIFLKEGSLTMLDTSSIRDHRSVAASAVVAIAEDTLPAIFTMKDKSIVTDNRVAKGWGAVLKLVCDPAEVPALVGVKNRVTGNTPKDFKTACP